ncbi:MAG TPA: primosomal protein N' [Puia sp.]|nr:primosomal protein N' [Puia sp.]
MYAEVIIPLALPKNYTWSVPEQWRLQIREGCRVEVELKNKKYAGIVKRLHQDKPAAFEPKAIGNVLDAEPILHLAQLQLWEWIAGYYLCSEGEVMAAALPAHFKLSSETILVFNEETGDDFTHLDHDEYLVAEALTIKKELKITEVQQILDSSHVYPVIKRLIEKKVCFVWEALKETYSAKKESYILLNHEYHNEDKLAKLLNDWDPPADDSASGSGQKTPKKSSGPRAPKQLELLLAYLHLSRTQGEVTKPDLLKKSGASDAQLKGLIEKNILWVERRSVDRLKYLPRDITIDFELSPAQQRAFEEIGQALQQRSVCLLHGVTASGKTEVYIRQMELAIRQGRQVLYLLPEIALTSQIIRRLQKHFGGYIGIYHSKFSQNERLEIWNKIRTGELKIILGARSSLFLPFEDLGLIVADEEHDPSYKQQEPAPRYHARDAAIYYASLFQSKVLLGSATPSVETYYNASTGKYGLVELNERYGQVQLPDISIIDTKLLRPTWNNAYKNKQPGRAAHDRPGPQRYGSGDPQSAPGSKNSPGVKGSRGSANPPADLFSDNPLDDLFGAAPTFPGQTGTPFPNTIDPTAPHPGPVPDDAPTPPSRDNSKVILSPQLKEAIEHSLAVGKQVILFQNRRGYSPYQVCEVCGWIPQCRNCDVSLNFHKLTNKLHCHYCGTVYPPLHTCAACGNHRFVQRNFGTERIEEFLEETFPKARIARMDIDSVRGKTAHDSLIQQFEQQRIDILVGTQMVVKGLDFEHVNLVGILDADSILSFADFRVNERAFQLMEQVSGRAGRKDGEGRVLIQVANTGHPVLSYLKTHDYKIFFQHEIAARQQFFYPPYSRVIMITFRHRDKEVVQSAAQFFANNLKQDFGKYLVGPAEPAVGRVRNQYLMELLLKLPKDGHTISFAKHVIQQQTAILHNDRKFRSVVIIPDVDAL